MNSNTLAPSLPPSEVHIRMLNLTTLRIGWRAPPADGMNGILKGFQVIHFSSLQLVISTILPTIYRLLSLPIESGFLGYLSGNSAHLFYNWLISEVFRWHLDYVLL